MRAEIELFRIRQRSPAPNLMASQENQQTLYEVYLVCSLEITMRLVILALAISKVSPNDFGQGGMDTITDLLSVGDGNLLLVGAYQKHWMHQ